MSKKLKWIKKNKFQCVFSHYQNCKIWEKQTKTKFRYLPFAYDDKYFFYSKKKKSMIYLLVVFCKIRIKAQSDIRIKILNKLYYTLFNIPLIKKKYRNLSIFWNSIPNNVCGYIISKIFKTYNFS